MPPRRRYCYIVIIAGATAIRTLKLIITPLDCCGVYLFSLGRGLPLVVRNGPCDDDNKNPLQFCWRGV